MQLSMRAEPARLLDVLLCLFQRLALSLFSCRTLGAREARARVDVVDRAVERVADLIGLDLDFPVAERLAALRVALRSHLWLLHGRADEVAPFGPRAVVVLHVLEPEQMLEHEPREARSLADTAVRDDGGIAGDALIGVKLLQLLHTLERPVVVAVLSPRDTLGAWNVTAALAGFRKPRRREDLPGELCGASHVDERGLLLRRRLLHVGQKRAQRHVRRAGFVGLCR